MKNTKEITISIPEGYEIDKEKSTFEKIVFKKKETTTLPKTWEELKKITGWYIDAVSNINELDASNTLDTAAEKSNRNVFFLKEQAEAAVALAQLTQLREVYRQGWVPDWTNTSVKHCIHVSNNNVETCNYTTFNKFLSFKTAKIRDEFFKNFKNLIIQAMPLLG